ncbi:carboxymuconolactone decarboxylase family protein [Rhizobium sp. BK251]|uniref:carboxymuconolactone decarboxylase family protein n=1 Tax=Rhizobium sp. BK251 TaxID=2512125 RepID=UPI001045D484|nr:carboxymuconolactone decarboxylase family protein [Rhizobium sp. BK251]TCL70155.1 putative peroxidase-related enzyme [Rhizobium sp. BK251]
MSRIAIPSRDAVPAASQPILDAVERQLGSVPNLFRLVSISPAALSALTGLSGALGKTLDAKTRTRIALAVAQANSCDYCLSAHSYIGLNLNKLDQEELLLNRSGASGDRKANAAVHFAARVAETRGQVEDDELEAVRAAGYTDAQVIEIIGVVAENFFTNLVNKVADTDMDFPIVSAGALRQLA